MNEVTMDNKEETSREWKMLRGKKGGCGHIDRMVMHVGEGQTTGAIREQRSVT